MASMWLLLWSYLLFFFLGHYSFSNNTYHRFWLGNHHHLPLWNRSRKPPQAFAHNHFSDNNYPGSQMHYYTPNTIYQELLYATKHKKNWNTSRNVKPFQQLHFQFRFCFDFSLSRAFFPRKLDLDFLEFLFDLLNSNVLKNVLLREDYSVKKVWRKKKVENLACFVLGICLKKTGNWKWIWNFKSSVIVLLVLTNFFYRLCFFIFLPAIL